VERSGTRWSTISLALALWLASLGASVVTAGLPALQEAFGAPLARVQGVVVAYLLSTTALVVVAGRLGDLLGRRRLLLAGLALFAAGSAACGLAPGLEALLAARAAQGAGAAALLALAPALLGDAAPSGQAGRALGLLATASSVGTALGPSLGGLLLGLAGWRAPFLVLAALGLAALLVARRHLPPERPATAGAARAPLLPLALLREPALRGGLLASALAAAVVMATLVVGPFHLARGLGLEPALVGLALSTGPAVSALVGAPAGRWVDRAGARPVGIAGLAAMLVGALALSAAPLRLGVPGYLAPLVVLTGGYALLQTANTTAALAGRAEQRGVVSGLLALSRNLGLVSGASALGAVFARASALDLAPGLPAAVGAGTRVTFAAATLLLVAATVSWLLAPDPLDRTPVTAAPDAERRRPRAENSPPVVIRAAPAPGARAERGHRRPGRLHPGCAHGPGRPRGSWRRTR
jgi:MFS family permease